MVLDDNAEIAITGAVVLVLLTGKVPEDNAFSMMMLSVALRLMIKTPLNC